ncbi:MAG: hypothetical protein ABFS45_15400 [Pseudomonadota bacterium]
MADLFPPALGARLYGILGLVFLCAVASQVTVAYDMPGELSGNVTPQQRYFFQDADSGPSYRSNLSLAVEPEFYLDWQNRRQALTIKLFARLDQRDQERTHVDIRELNWLKIQGDWEWRLGIGKVFWGVTESNHLVDIINQTDTVENIDDEDKLGQPMVQAIWLRDWGAVQFFMLPYFRERNFPGKEARLRPPLVVDSDRAEFESSRANRHIDWAIRANGSLGPLDLGISQFIGTGRTPQLLPARDDDGNPILIPRYNQIKQTGLEAQAIVGDWLWKLEAIYQFNPVEDFFAAVGGFEYTFVGVFKSVVDVGALAEFNYDAREGNSPSPFQNDLFVGTRLSFNDVQSSEILAGGFFDLNTAGLSLRIEAARRLGEHWKLSLELQTLANIDQKDPLFGLRKDDFLQIDLGYFF